jgi:hypothetical protein
MKIKLIPAIIAIGIAAIAAAPPSQATETTIEQMPADLETRFALSALPPVLRDKATVYLLDPKKGYSLSRPGTSGVACLVERTAWELADFRNDIYIPLLRRRGREGSLQSHHGRGRASHSGTEPRRVESGDRKSI